MLWSVRLLGGLSVRGRDGREVTRLRTRKVGVLLAYLALRAGPSREPLPRERLCAALWPDADETTGRHNLSNSLTVLRAVLEPPGVAPGAVLEADRHTLRLRPDTFSCDAVEFERKADEALIAPSGADRAKGLTAACSLYTGPLLGGIAEEDWASEEAARLSSLFLRAAITGAEALLESGDAITALALAGRAVAEDPLSAEAVSCVMRAHMALKEPSVAHAVFRRYERRLRAEMGADEEIPPALEELSRDARRLAGAAKTGRSAGGSGRRGQPTDAVASPVSPITRFADLRDLPADSAALASITTTRFFGREAELERLSQMLSAPRTRLVTVTGPGGTGKTRLALETAAARNQNTTPEKAQRRTLFVPLADVRSGEGIPSALLRALDVKPDPRQHDLRGQVADVLANGASDFLLILDNFEQLTDAGGAEELTALLAATPPGVRLLVTSRIPLRVVGEWEFRLSPLSTTGGTTDLNELEGLPAVALFVDRAQMARPEFELSAMNATDVAALVDRLEGVPLAIELAAARAGVLSPAQMVEQLDARPLDALAATRRDIAARHRSLRTMLEWSAELLPSETRDFLADMSVFRGGWTLEAAQAVSPDADALEMLTQLRDASLVNVADQGEGLRFSLPETVRQFATELLEASMRAERVRTLHRDWFLALAEEAEPQLTGPNQGFWLARLGTEHDNLRAALEWCAEDSPASGAEAKLQMAGALWRFWSVHSHLAEGRQHLERALTSDRVPGGTAMRARALLGVGNICFTQGDYEPSRAFCEEALGIYRRLGEAKGIADSLHALGNLGWALGQFLQAKALYEESLSVRRELNDLPGIASSLNNLGIIAERQGDSAEALALRQEGLRVQRQIGDKRGIAGMLHALGVQTFSAGDYERARALNEEGLYLQRELGDHYGIIGSLAGLGLVALAQNDLAAAQASFDESLTVARGLGNPFYIAHNLDSLGLVSYLMADFGRASAHFEEAMELSRKLGDDYGVAHTMAHLGLVALARGDHSTALDMHRGALKLFRDQGAREAQAQILSDFAAIFLAQAKPRKAACLLGAEDILRDSVGNVRIPWEQKRVEDARAACRVALGDAAFAAAWDEGGSLNFEQAIRLALGEETLALP